MSDDQTRDRGILTNTDRRFLTGDKEYTGDNAKQQRYQRRVAIRERVENGIRDLDFLARELDDVEVEKIAARMAQDFPEQSVMRGPGGLDRSVTGAVAFLFRLFKEDIHAFEETVSEGVGRGMVQVTGDMWDVAVGIDVARTRSQNEIIEHLESGDAHVLSAREAQWALRQLAQGEELDPSLFREDPEDRHDINFGELEE